MPHSPLLGLALPSLCLHVTLCEMEILIQAPSQCALGSSVEKGLVVVTFEYRPYSSALWLKDSCSSPAQLRHLGLHPLQGEEVS